MRLVVALLRVGTALALAGSRPASAQAQSVDEAESRAILTTVEQWAAAMRTKDTVGMRRAMHPTARLYGMRPTRDGGLRVQLLEGGDFLRFVATDTRAAWTETFTAPELRIRGTMATVWVRYEFRFGDALSHCGVDAFQLLKVDGRWLIVSIADTYETVGCAS